MSTTTLSRDECRDDVLPMVCVKCGRRSRHERRVTFHRLPTGAGGAAVLLFAAALGGVVAFRSQWFGFLLLPAILALARPAKRDATLPVCGGHPGPWNRAVLHYVTASLFGLLGLIASAFVSRFPFEVRAAVGAVTAALVGVTLVVAVVAQYRGVRAVKITRDELTLTNVHPDFIDALEDERERAEAIAEARRAARRAARRGPTLARRVRRADGGGSP